MGAAAYATRTAIVAFQSFKSAGPRMRQFYKGGFQSDMNRREAALILGTIMIFLFLLGINHQTDMILVAL